MRLSNDKELPENTFRKPYKLSAEEKLLQAIQIFEYKFQLPIKQVIIMFPFTDSIVEENYFSDLKRP